MDPKLAIADATRDRIGPAPTTPRVSATLFVPTIDARILAANVRAQTPAMVKRLGTIVVGDDDARALGAYCTALRMLLKGRVRVHGLTAPNGRPIHSLRDYVRAYFDVPATDDFKSPGSRGKRIVNTINHYSNTYGATHLGGGSAHALRSPFDALRAHIARVFPSLGVEEAHTIVVDVTSRYEALVKRMATSTARSPIRAIA